MTDLLKEFDAGRAAALEGVSADACPYYATSPAADAWHAGRAFEGPRPTDFVLHKVTKGRGELVNVHHNGRYPARQSKLVYRVSYPRKAFVPIVTREA